MVSSSIESYLVIDNLQNESTRFPCSEVTTETIPFVNLDVPKGRELKDWLYPYGPGEVIWGVLLVIGIFGVNSWVLWIVIHSRELWKPRHLWMACLCVTDLFVGVHKVIELILLIVPVNQLCIINKATLGIPYILNILLLTCLSLDRFLAVTYPFLYSSVVSNKHVGFGFLLVLLIGCGLSWASIAIGFHDVVCRVHCLQLKYLSVALTLCSILTLFFNISVLRIAKRQLNAICKISGNSHGVSQRPLAVICTNCGHKTETILPICLPPAVSTTQLSIPSFFPARESCFQESVPLNYEIQLADLGNLNSMKNTNDILTRTKSLPTLAEIVPIRMDDRSELESPDLGNGNHGNHLENSYIERNSPGLFPRSQTEVELPRLLLSTRDGPMGSRFPFFRNLNFSKNHVFHVGRLFPSIRFAKTVLLIMIPMWLFILPVITIIPLHQTCVKGSTTFGCDLVDILWNYLLIHIRSVLLLQAILDTLIYACRSKEFRHALNKDHRWSFLVATKPKR